jgi:hypothetical protein
LFDEMLLVLSLLIGVLLLRLRILGTEMLYHTQVFSSNPTPDFEAVRSSPAPAPII